MIASWYFLWYNDSIFDKIIIPHGIFDKFNCNQEEMKRIADEYIAEGETLKKLIF